MKTKTLLTLALAPSASIAAAAAPPRDPALSQRLTDALGMKSWAEKVQTYGAVKLITYNCDCRRGGFLFLGGAGQIITQKAVYRSLEAKVENEPTFKAQHPQILLNRAETYQGVTTLPQGGRRFLFANLVSECEACEPFGAVQFAFDFNPAGKLVAQHFVSYTTVEQGAAGVPPPAEQ